MTMEDLQDHPGAIEHLRAGCPLQVARLVRRELVIDKDKLRLPHSVSVRLHRCRLRLLVLGTFEALACLRLPRHGERFDDAGPARHCCELLEAPLAEDGAAVDPGALLRYRGD